ncbi:hypothetical protein [Streptomyces sporangiiformans]|uniref:Uncharacterized protein n=1 Tax=Streptomyces sporangiiformans TaxID=2315329 RepID=A0A505D8N4_9ACTN|nr:hypothetical protein [Streptomyces sporangiiformans]TPQ18970.1 hypothetical protein FGD71_028205 [Streptomyces sporangiiformans]
MNERMKPPARRTGRTLGGAKKAAPPPPPPTAELTPQQFAAERAADQGEGRRAAGEPQVQPVPSTVSVEGSAQGGTETGPHVAQASAQPNVEITPSSPVQEPVASQPDRAAVVAPGPGTESAGEPVERQVPPAAPAAEVAVRPAVPPVAGGTAFPLRTVRPSSHHEQDVRSQEAPSEGTPYAHGPGRLKDVPEPAVVLNQRIIARESLDSSVPAALKLKKRIKRFALDNELDHLPIGDIVSVALDEWLTARGF